MAAVVRAVRWARKGAGLLCVLGIAVAGCTSDQEKVRQYLGEAEALQEEGQDREAMLLLRNALQIEPDNASINMEIAETLMAMGRPADAGFYYGEAYRLDPTLSEAALARAPLLYGSETDEARELVEEVLEREPDNHMAYYRKAEIHLLEPDTEAALSAALTAVELEPDAPETHRIVGRVYETMAREDRTREGEIDASLYRKALEAFQRAAERGGAWYHHNDIAQLYSRWPEHETETREAWRRAFATAREAEEDREEAMRTVAVAAFRWATRNEDPAFQRWALERRLEVDPDQGGIWAQLASVAEAQEEGGGEAVWKQALEERPEDPLIHVAYANYLGRTRGVEEASAHLESLPPEVARSFEIELLLTKSYASQGRLEDARQVVARMRERDPENALTDFAAARLAMAEGRLDEAAQTFRTIADELERADLYRLLAQAELARRDPRSALAAVNRALEINRGPGRLRLYRLRHRSQMAIGDWEGLLASLRRMRREGLPVQMMEMLQLVRANYELGQGERGRRVLEQLVSVDEPPRAVVLAFAQLEGRRQPERARELLLEDLERGGPGPRLVRLLTQIELDQGRPERALEHLARVDAEDLGPGLRLQRARALARLGRLEEAEAEARAAFEHSSTPPAAAQMLAQILRAQDRQEEAIAALEAAREERRLPGRNLWLLGRMYLENGDLEAARVVLEEAVGAAPNLHVAHNDLAYVLAETGENLERALALASQARSALPESPAVADTLGWVYYRRGMHRAAADEFRAALQAAEEQGEDTPNAMRADIQYHLALALRELGSQAEALRAVDRALELQPDHPEARDMRAELAATTVPGSDG